MSDPDVFRIPGGGALRERLDRLLSAAGDRTRTTKVLAAILGEGLDYAEGKSDVTSPTLDRLRSPSTVAGQARELVTRAPEIEGRLERMEQQIAQIAQHLARGGDLRLVDPPGEYQTPGDPPKKPMPKRRAR